MENTVKLLHQSLQDGYDTLDMLAIQKEKLEHSQKSLNKIEYSITQSKRILRGMKSFFGSIRNWFSSNIKLKEIPPEKKNMIYPRISEDCLNEIPLETPLDEASDLLDKLEEVANILNSELDKQNETVENVKEQTYEARHKLQSLIVQEKELLNST